MNDARLGELAAVISVLSAHRAILHDLADFEPVGTLGEAVQGVLVGTGSLSRSDLDRLRNWSARWSMLDPSVRTFYRIAFREVQPDRRDRALLEGCAWRLIDSRSDKWTVPASTRRALDRLHLELVGRPAGSDLLPSLSTETEP